MQCAAAHIERLPNEIVKRILLLLSQQDLIALAVAWRNAIAMINHIISPNLENISVMFETRSLETFSRILEVQEFAQRVRTLTVHICHFLPIGQLDYVESLLGEQWGYKPLDEEFYDEELYNEEQFDEEQSHEEFYDEEQSDEEQFKALLDDQNQLMTSALPLRCFIKAIKELKQCESFLISDELLLNGICRPGKGVRRFTQGPLTLDSKTSVEFVTRVLSVILHAAMHPGVCSDSTSNSNLRSLTINIGLSYSSMPCNGVRPDMLSCFPAPITSIRQLSITLDCNFLENSEASQPGADFGTFIKALPNLLDFELQVVGEDWLEKPFGLLGSIIIPKLQKLTLECLKCREHELDDFLLRHKSTLTDIHFSAVHLDDDSQSWDRLLRNIKNGPNNPKIIMAECEPDGGMVDAYQRLYTSSEKDAS